MSRDKRPPGIATAFRNFDYETELDRLKRTAVSGGGGAGTPGPQGPAGTPGEKWYTGAGAPPGATGIVGDWYLDSVTGDYYEKTGTSAWTLRGNLKGPIGATGSQGPQGYGVTMKGYVATVGSLPTGSFVTPVAPTSLGNLNTSATPASISLTLTDPVAVGETVLVAVVAKNASRTFVGFSDSKGNAYTTDVDDTPNLSLRTNAGHVVVTNALSAGDTITATHSGTVSDVRNLIAVKSTQALTLDQVAHANSGGSASAPYSSGNLVTTATTALLWGVAGHAGGASSTPSASIIELHDFNGTTDGYRILSAPGTYAYTGTWSSGAQVWGAVGLIFKIGAAGGNQQGDCYIVQADDSFWMWDGTAWVSGGSIQGPKGDTGLTGPAGPTIDATTTTKGVVQLAGDLTGTAASPQIAAGAVTDAEVAAANKDGTTATPSMRTIGSGAQQAMGGNTRLDQIPAPIFSVGLNGQTIQQLSNPAFAQDAATKSYVDSLVQGLDAKQSVRAATPAAVTLSGLQTIDGVVLAMGDRVLCKAQAPASGNGIYLASTGAWPRAADLDAWAEVPGAFVFVEEGTVFKDTGWVCTANPGGTLGSTTMLWTQFSSAGTIVAGAGLAQTGMVFDVQVDGVTTEIMGNQVSLKEDGVTNWEIAPATIRDTEIAAANKDGVVGTPSMRTIGVGAQQAMAGATKLNQVPLANGLIDANANRIANISDPVNQWDAANKQYVDAFAQGLDAHPSVKVASPTNVAISSAPATIDGIAMFGQDRVLLFNQTNPAQNGIYRWVAGGMFMARADDADIWNEHVSAYVFVERGNTYADNGFLCTVDTGGTLGTDPITWVQFSGAGQITAGAGLTKTGNTLDAVAGAGIQVNADSVQVANNGITNAMLADGAVNLGSLDVTGTLLVGKGGTGGTTMFDARSNLEAAGIKSYTAHAAGTSISIPQSTHGLRAYGGLCVQVQDAVTGMVEIPDVTVAANGDVTIYFAVAVAANSKRITITG